VSESIELKALQFLNCLKAKHQTGFTSQINAKYSISHLQNLHKQSIYLHDKALPVIASTLNTVFNTTLSDHYWSIRLYPILSSLTAILAERQQTLSSTDNSSFHTSLVSDVNRVGRFTQYVDAIQSIEFSSKTNSSISTLLKELELNRDLEKLTYIIGLRQKSTLYNQIRMLFSRARNIVYLIALNLLLFLLPIRKITLFSPGDSSYLSNFQDINKTTSKSLQLAVPLPEYCTHLGSCNLNKTHFLHLISNEIALIDDLKTSDIAILQLACLMMPYEIFDASLIASAFTASLQPNKHIYIYSAVAHISSPIFRAFISHMTQYSDVHIVTIEHGGSIPVAFEQSEQELLFSRLRCVNYSTYHPKHIRVRRREHRTDTPLLPRQPLNQILFILPSIQSFYYRSSSQYTPYSGAVTCCNALAIAENLFNRHATSMTLRIQSNRDPINNSFLDLVRGSDFASLSDAPSIGTEIKNNDLLVTFYPETTVVDCYFSGKPFLVYVDRSCYEFHPRFTGVVNKLVESGIVHDDFSELCSFIETLHDDALTLWWSSEPVQRALYEFQRMCL